MQRFCKIPFTAFAVVLAACMPQSTPTPLPVPSPTRTLAASTATIAPPSATNVPATATHVPVAPSPIPVFTRLATVFFRNLDVPPPISITLVLKPEPGLAAATFTARGNQSLVQVDIQSGARPGPQSAVIFEGSCNQPGLLRYTLPELVNGKSATTLNLPLAALLSGVLNLDIKDPTRPGDGSLACATIPEAVFINLDQGSQPGTVVAFEQAGGTEVDMFLKPGPPGVSQPAFIREGKCNDLGAIRYSLNAIVDGTSKTFFGTRFSEFKKEKGALNVHKSVLDLDTSVACGMVVPGGIER